MEEQKLTVNDGGGLYDNIGMIESLIVDCNNLPSLLFQGKNVAFCSMIVQMVQKLSRLREGVKNDTEAMQNKIDELTQYINKGEYADV